MSGPGDRDRDGTADSAYESVLDASGWVPSGDGSPFEGCTDD